MWTPNLIHLSPSVLLACISDLALDVHCKFQDGTLKFLLQACSSSRKIHFYMSNHLYPIFQTSSSGKLNSSWHIPWILKFFRFYLKNSSQITFIVAILTSSAMTQIIISVFVLIIPVFFPFSRYTLDSSPHCWQSPSYKMKPMALVCYSKTS